MAELSRFFNSEIGDVREYNASEFAEYFSRFLTDGIYVTEGNLDLKVSADSGMNVNIATGYAFIRGYMYKNDAALSKTIVASDATLDRIDRVILKFDEVNKSIEIIVKNGTLASSPVAPALVNTDTIREISLAQIRINKGVTSILSGNITDERVSEFGGVVSSLITIPIDDLWDAWNLEIADIQSEWDTWFGSLDVGIFDADLITTDATHRFITDVLLSKLSGIATEANKYVHPGSGTNPHSTTKTDVGLGSVDNNTQMPIAGGTFTGVAKSQTNTSYTTAQLRNVILSTADAVVSSMNNGDIWIKYS